MERRTKDLRQSEQQSKKQRASTNRSKNVGHRARKIASRRAEGEDTCWVWTSRRSPSPGSIAGRRILITAAAARRDAAIVEALQTSRHQSPKNREIWPAWNLQCGSGLLIRGRGWKLPCGSELLVRVRVPRPPSRRRRRKEEEVD